jgi:hypothetical protein
VPETVVRNSQSRRKSKTKSDALLSVIGFTICLHLPTSEISHRAKEHCIVSASQLLFPQRVGRTETDEPLINIHDTALNDIRSRASNENVVKNPVSAVSIDRSQIGHGKDQDRGSVSGCMLAESLLRRSQPTNQDRKFEELLPVSTKHRAAWLRCAPLWSFVSGME